MATTRKDVEMVIKARDDASRALKRINQSLADLKKVVRDTSKEVSGSAAQFKKMDAALGAIRSNEDVAKVMRDVGQSFRAASDTVARLKASTGQSREEMKRLRRVMSAAGKTVADTSIKIRNLQSRMAAMRETTAKQRKTLGDLKAQLRAAARNYAKLAAAQKKAGASGKAYAAEVRAAKKEMQAAERAVARQEKALARSVEATKKSASALKTLKLQLAGAKKEQTRLRAAVKRATGSYNDYNQALKKAKDTQKQAAADVAKIRQAYRRLVSELEGGLVKALRDQKKELLASKVAWKGAERAVRSYAREMRRSGDSTAEAKAKLAELAAQASLSKAKWEELAAAYRGSQQVLDTARRDVDGLREAMARMPAAAEAAKKTASALRQIGEALKAQEDKVKSSKAAWKEAEASLRSYTAALRKQGYATAQEQEKLDALHREAKRGKAIFQENAAALRRMSDTARKAGRSEKELGLALRKMEAEAKRSSDAVRGLARAEMQISSISIKAATAMQRFRAALARARGEMDRTASSSRKAEQGLKGVSRGVVGVISAYVGIHGVYRGLRNVVKTTQSWERATTALATSMDYASKTASNLTPEIQRQGVEAGTAAASSKLYAQQLAWLKKEAEYLGLGLTDTISTYAKFTQAATSANYTLGQATEIYHSVAKAAVALGLPMDQVKLIFLALEQMASKGTVNMEELRRQMGDHLPGAFKVFAKAAGYSEDRLGEFYDAIKKGKIHLSDLTKLAGEMDKRFGGKLNQALGLNIREMTRMSNAWLELKLQFSKSGFLSSVTGLFKDMAAAMRSENAKRFARALGLVASALIELVRFMVRHWEVFTAFAVLMGGRMVVSIGKFIASNRVLLRILPGFSIVTRIGKWFSGLGAIIGRIGGTMGRFGKAAVDLFKVFGTGASAAGRLGKGLTSAGGAAASLARKIGRGLASAVGGGAKALGSLASAAWAAAKAISGRIMSVLPSFATFLRVALRVALRLASVAVRVLITAFMNLNPWVRGAVIAFGALVAAIKLFSSGARGAEKSAESLTEAQKKLNEQGIDLSSEEVSKNVEEYKGALDSARAASEKPIKPKIEAPTEDLTGSLAAIDEYAKGVESARSKTEEPIQVNVSPESQTSLDGLAASMQETADTAGQTKVEYQNLAKEVAALSGSASQVSEAFGAIASAAGGLAESASKASEAFKVLRETSVGFPDDAVAVESAITSLGDAIAGLQNGFSGFSGAVTNAAASLKEIADSVSVVASNAGSLDKALTTAGKSISALQKQASEAGKSVRILSGQVKEVSTSASELKASVKGLETKLKSIASEASKLARSVRSVSKNASAAARDLADLGKVAGDASSAISKAASGVREIASAARSAASAFRAMAAAADRAAEAARRAANAAAKSRVAKGHTGGIVRPGGSVGGNSPRHDFPSLMFSAAPRLHSGGIVGLKPDEVPAVLQVGEEVITRGDPRHSSNIGKRVAAFSRGRASSSPQASLGGSSSSGEDSFARRLSETVVLAVRRIWEAGDHFADAVGAAAAALVGAISSVSQILKHEEAAGPSKAGSPSPLVAGELRAAELGSGGLVMGRHGTSRKVSELLFAGAKRYASGGIVGLGPDEVPAILHVGEEVLTRSDPRHRKNRSKSANDFLLNGGASRMLENVLKVFSAAGKTLAKSVISAANFFQHRVRDSGSVLVKAAGMAVTIWGGGSGFALGSASSATGDSSGSSSSDVSSSPSDGSSSPSGDSAGIPVYASLSRGGRLVGGDNMFHPDWFDTWGQGQGGGWPKEDKSSDSSTPSSDRGGGGTGGGGGNNDLGGGTGGSGGLGGGGGLGSGSSSSSSSSNIGGGGGNFDYSGPGTPDGSPKGGGGGGRHGGGGNHGTPKGNPEIPGKPSKNNPCGECKKPKTIMEYFAWVKCQAARLWCIAKSKLANVARHVFGHTGGVVTETGIGSNNSMFPPVYAPIDTSSVPRYHSGGLPGLKPGEVPAILKKGEEVLTQSDPRHIGNMGMAAVQGGSGVSLKIVNTVDAQDFVSSALGEQTGEDTILNTIKANRAAVKEILS